MYKNASFMLIMLTLLAFCGFTLTFAEAAPAGQNPSPSVNKVNVNTASAEQLLALPGIGPKIADRIIAWRTENGNFQRVEDLMAVKGIGEKKFSRIRDMVTVK